MEQADRGIVGQHRAIRGRSGGWPPGLVELYRDRYLNLVRTSYLIVGNQSVAEEVTQEAFMAAAEHFEGVEKPVAYLRTAVANRSRSWIRRQVTERTHRPAPPDPARLEADEMWDALGRLDERRRTAVVLRFYEQLPDAEIAEILECEPATVRTLIHRALADLRKEVER